MKQIPDYQREKTIFLGERVPLFHLNFMRHLHNAHIESKRGFYTSPRPDEPRLDAFILLLTQTRLAPLALARSCVRKEIASFLAVEEGSSYYGKISRMKEFLLHV